MSFRPIVRWMRIIIGRSFLFILAFIILATCDFDFVGEDETNAQSY